MSTVQEAKRAALAVLEELGWTRASVDSALVLPLGDLAQQRTVRAALNRGGWEEWSPQASLKWPGLETDAAVLALYAARVGTPSGRVAALAGFLEAEGDWWWAVADLVARQGPAAELEYVLSFYGTFSRDGANEASHQSELILRRIHASGLELPHSVEYAKDFWAHSASRLGAVQSLQPWDVVHRPVEEEVLRARFAEHVRLTARVAAPVTGQFGPAVRAAFARGWIQRAELIDAALVALDAPIRPGDRKVWAKLLEGEVALSERELLEHKNRIIPMLSVGDASVLEALGVPLIAAASPEDLEEILLAVSGTPTGKWRLAVVRALRDRPAPPVALARVLVEVMRPWGVAQAPVAVALDTLLAAWNVPQETQAKAGVNGAGEPDYPWPATPPVWEVPRVDWGEATREALTEAVLPLVHRAGSCTDLAVERFLSTANRLAALDPDQVRGLVLAIARDAEYERPALDEVMAWSTHERIPTSRGSDPPDLRRNNHVAGRLGLSPVILSQPSWEDLRVDLADLTGRLEVLQRAGKPALESDLALALTRLEFSSDRPDLRRRLDAVNVPLVSWDGVQRSGIHAAAVVLDYLQDPVQEPVVTPALRRSEWIWKAAGLPPALRTLRARPGSAGVDQAWTTQSAFPTWGDAVGFSLRDVGGPAPHDISASLWHQLARRRDPLTPGLAMSLLSGLRRKDHGERELHFEAARLAWARGLLVPGVASVNFFDWVGTPNQLGALAAAWMEAAEDGLLPVVWPLMDRLCTWGASSVQLPNEMADLATAMRRLAPSVVAAVASGGAPDSVVDVPGLRLLAGRRGQSQAVRMARETVAILPRGEAAPTPTPTPALRPSQAHLASAWPGDIADPAVLEDGVLVHAIAAPRSEMAAGLVFLLELPGDQQLYRVDPRLNSFTLASSRTSHAYRLPPGADPLEAREESRWLAWDAQANALVPRESPARGQQPHLSQGLCTVAVGALAQPAAWRHAAQADIQTLVKRGYLGAQRVQRAARVLFHPADGVPFPSGALSPARMAQTVVEMPGYLPALWPVLTEAVHAASVQEKAPRWLNGVLDCALDQAPVLAEAARRGHMAAEWPGLAELAARPGKSAALSKARTLWEVVG